jgi:cation transport ATPase
MGTTRVDLPVQRMSCASCVGKIEKAVTRLADVQSASINLAAERATATYEPARPRVPETAGRGPTGGPPRSHGGGRRAHPASAPRRGRSALAALKRTIDGRLAEQP